MQTHSGAQQSCENTANGRKTDTGLRHGNGDSSDNVDNLLTVRLSKLFDNVHKLLTLRLSKLLDSPCPGVPRMSAVHGNDASDENYDSLLTLRLSKLLVSPSLRGPQNVSSAWQ